MASARLTSSNEYPRSMSLAMFSSKLSEPADSRVDDCTKLDEFGALFVSLLVGCQVGAFLEGMGGAFVVLGGRGGGTRERGSDIGSGGFVVLGGS